MPSGGASGGTLFKDGALLTTGRSRVYTHRDRRYGTARWRKLRIRILERDAWRCRIGIGCDITASVADHIEPVYEGMPDSLFFDPRNLRAGCKRHNVARGVAARLMRETGGVG
jgi:hypothetical protein